MTLEKLSSQQLFTGITFGASGLLFDERTVTLDAWAEAGQRLGQMHRISGFALGDWMNYGQAKFSISEAAAAKDEIHKEARLKYEAAIRMTGLDVQTLTNMASIAARFQPGERLAELSFAHHAEVAYLDDKKQRNELLVTAREKDLRVKELRAITPKKPRKAASPTVKLTRKNTRLAKEMTEAVRHLKNLTKRVTVKNHKLILEFQEVINTLNDIMPEVSAAIQEAAATAMSEKEKEKAEREQ